MTLKYQKKEFFKLLCGINYRDNKYIYNEYIN